jgi:hypothetical protein
MAFISSLKFPMMSVGTWTRARCNVLRNESQTNDACNVTLTASLCAWGRTGEEGLSACQVCMKGVNKGNVSCVGAEAQGKLQIYLNISISLLPSTVLPVMILVLHLPVFDVVHLPALAQYTHISLPTSCTMFVFITQCSYMFRPYILDIFRELQICLTCTAYKLSYTLYTSIKLVR